MNIVLFCPHHWPIPTPAHTGHIVILDLATALSALGHHVTMVAPEGTDFHRLAPMGCSQGLAEPTATHCEVTALHEHKALFDAADIIHDWSVEKHAAEWYPAKSIATIMSGCTTFPRHGRNVVTWTNEARSRALRGASDYEGTEFTQWHSMTRPLRDARVVNGGVDTDFWTPPVVNVRGDHLLWLGRFHPARGYALAIDLAKQNPDLSVVIAGEHPDHATNDHQKECAIEAETLAQGVPNCRVEWLPREGHREAVREQYRRARTFLMVPRFREPFGLQQAEALACGTPVVGVRIGSVPEVISHCATGFVVEPSYLAQACRKVDAIDSARCREEAVRRFDRSAMARNYVEVYEECLKGGWG